MEGSRRAAKHTQSWEEWWQAFRAGRSDGGGQEGSQTHSEPGGVVGVGSGGQPNTLRAGRSGGGVTRRAAKRTQSREESIGDAMESGK